MKILEAIQAAKEAGFTSIETFAGPLSLDDWQELTSLTHVHYENEKIVTDWLPSILERGKLERLAFVLIK